MATFAHYLSATGQTPEQHAAACAREDDLSEHITNPFIRLADSTLDGRGATPTRGFNAGDRIGLYLEQNGKRTPLARWVNHDDRPSARGERDDFGNVVLVATRNIFSRRQVQRELWGTRRVATVAVPADEITVDYMQIHRLLYPEG